jgi:predicted transcriptional regulator
MEVHFAPDTETRLKDFAARKGKDAAQVVEETVSNMLQRQAGFVEGVERGIASADRGDLIDHEDVVRRIDARKQEPPPVIIPPRGKPISAVPRTEVTRIEEEEDAARHARSA